MNGGWGPPPQPRTLADWVSAAIDQRTLAYRQSARAARTFLERHFVHANAAERARLCIQVTGSEAEWTPAQTADLWCVREGHTSSVWRAELGSPLWPRPVVLCVHVARDQTAGIELSATTAELRRLHAIAPSEVVETLAEDTVSIAMGTGNTRVSVVAAAWIPDAHELHVVRKDGAARVLVVERFGSHGTSEEVGGEVPIGPDPTEDVSDKVVPWSRLCVSQDMIDREICDRKFPFKWRSSLAVFGYEPPADYQNYPGMTVSYLKVVCTITGFQPDPDEVGLTNRRVDSSWNDPAVIEGYTDVASKYYGCYGAVLEVSIGPHKGKVAGRAEAVASSNIEDYPYFADFEPKKRELYELVSDTGEVMSRSLEDVNVRKGSTTSNSHERVDIFGGMSAQASFAGTGGGFAVNGQWGTRDINQEEFSNVRTTDSAREMRETYSHTTQLTQMYHQLDSYHLGTNRAVFFMLPRPHIVQSDLTFVNGPRLLEGVQEFFLVVMRKKELPGFCVDAYLETGHIVSEPSYTYDKSAGRLTLHVAKQADDSASGSLGDDSSTTYAEDSQTFTAPAGWEIDLANAGGYKIESASGDRIESYSVTEATSDHVTVWGKVSARFEDRQWPVADAYYNGVLDVVVTVYLRKTTPTVSGYSQNLWITGRGVCCCPADLAKPMKTSVNFERPLKDMPDQAVGSWKGLTVKDANHLRLEIGRQLVQSQNHPDRYPRGQISFVDTKFVGRAVANLIRRDKHPDNVPVVDLECLDKAIAEKVAAHAPSVSRGRLLQMSVAELCDRFDLNHGEATKLRRFALGIEGPLVPPTERWDPPAKRALARKRSAAK